MKTEWTIDTLDEVALKLTALRELQAEYVLEARFVEAERPKRRVYQYHLRVTSSAHDTSELGEE